MRSAPKPQKKTSPLVWVGLLGAVAIVYITTMDSGPDPSTLKSSKAKAKKSTSKSDGIFTPEDETAKFPPLQLASVTDAFTPAVKKIVPVALPPVNTNKSNIPASITRGDGNWYFTGIVELNGRKQALLENTTSGETSYVSAGEGWKAGRISQVDIEAVVMVAPDGAVVRVPLQGYGDIPGASPTRIAAGPGGSQPLSLPAGTIGAGVQGGLGVRPVGGTATVQLPSGQTIQVPLDANATNDQNSNQNGGRRRRNRRQQNPGDQNNGL